MWRRAVNILVSLVVVGAGVIAAPSAANAASAPTTSPAAASRTFSTTWGFTCETGYACASVPYGNGWYTFKFYNYGTYYLNNWFGTDTAMNNQTNAAAMRFLNGSGGQIQCIAGQIGGVAHYDMDVDWNPIWRIQLTSSAC